MGALTKKVKSKPFLNQKRSSTSGIWINLTLLQKKDYSSKLLNLDQPTLDFRNYVLDNALGSMEFRTRKLTNNHVFYRDLFRGLKFKGLLEANAATSAGVNEKLGIYRDTPVNLRYEGDGILRYITY